MVLLKKLLNSWFDDFFLVRENFSFFHTVQFAPPRFFAKILSNQLFLLNIYAVNQFDEKS